MRLIKFLTLASLTSTVGLYKLSAGDNNNTTNIKILIKIVLLIILIIF